VEQHLGEGRDHGPETPKPVERPPDSLSTRGQIHLEVGIHEDVLPHERARLHVIGVLDVASAELQARPVHEEQLVMQVVGDVVPVTGRLGGLGQPRGPIGLDRLLHRVEHRTQEAQPRGEPDTPLGAGKPRLVAGDGRGDGRLDGHGPGAGPRPGP
jgi:hypothetical protein